MDTPRTARNLRSDGAEARATEGRLDQHHAEDLMIRDNLFIDNTHNVAVWYLSIN